MLKHSICSFVVRFYMFPLKRQCQIWSDNCNEQNFSAVIKNHESVINLPFPVIIVGDAVADNYLQHKTRRRNNVHRQNRNRNRIKVYGFHTCGNTFIVGINHICGFIVIWNKIFQICFSWNILGNVYFASLFSLVYYTKNVAFRLFSTFS